MLSSCTETERISVASVTVGIAPALNLPILVSKWHAICVCPRHEKYVAQRLGARQITYFLPLYSSLRRWKDRRKQIEMVLFPGYVFVNVALQEQLAVLMLPGVLRFVSFQGRPAVVPDHEVRAISAGSHLGIEVQPHPYLRTGQRVRVVAGPLIDTEGILVRRNGRFRLVLSVDSLMRSISLEVDECDVVPC
jgi:transcription antitermination factor NusG